MYFNDTQNVMFWWKLTRREAQHVMFWATTLHITQGAIYHESVTGRCFMFHHRGQYLLYEIYGTVWALYLHIWAMYGPIWAYMGCIWAYICYMCYIYVRIWAVHGLYLCLYWHIRPIWDNMGPPTSISISFKFISTSTTCPSHPHPTT